jgi:hypothetical protein
VKVDDVAREIAYKRWVVTEGLHVPIVAVDEQAIRTYVGDILGRVPDYFDETDGRIERWMFSTIPAEERASLTPFSVPRFHRTLTSWVTMIVEARLVFEAFGQPKPSPEVALAEPVVADTRVAPIFLHIRARKP